MTAVLSEGLAPELPAAASQREEHDWTAFTVADKDGARRLELAVSGITCAACMTDIERGLKFVPGVKSARVNLASRRTSVVYDPEVIGPVAVLDRMAAIGYPSHPFDPALAGDRRSEASRELLRCMAVAGFGAMNVMLMSVAVWAGNVTDITPETRDFFHWMSALIAIPAVGYAARPFFRSAFGALKRRSVNMDVPISIGVTLAMGLSLVNTMLHELEAYFDSALMLLFFLLLGRFLDENMRRRTAVEAETLATLRAESAVRIAEDGTLSRLPLSQVKPGDRILVRAGERVPVDGKVLSGRSDIDMSMVTGETLPARVSTGSMVHAGTLNGAGVLTVSVTAAVEGTLMAEIERLIGEAQTAKAGTLRLADRAARAYAPVVHSSALLTAVGWMIAGAGWHNALINAIAVLIITCPCALALAVPAVQVVGAGRFYRNGILLNAGDAVERLAKVDTIVFDKTGTLTLPDPVLLNGAEFDAQCLDVAGRLARGSRHPLAHALAEAVAAGASFEGIEETPGEGVAVTQEGRRLRLGSLEFCGVDHDAAQRVRTDYPTASLIAFADGSEPPRVFAFGQTLKADAVETAESLRKSGYRLEILSGDREAAVADIARALDIAAWKAECDPASKIERLKALKAEGRKVLMVGDGINDAPSLAAAHVSLSPVSAVHVAQAASDAVFLGDLLKPVTVSLEISKAAYRLMMENLGIAVIYNLFAVPIAVAGYVTPLIAALAMSGSSMIVTLNALRLRRVAEPPEIRPLQSADGETVGEAG
ncbi:heavy metal translocating P-type ATPase [Oryzibacter oryziterrae]|uniref:heavy metal translocating P-type ATPase n=1 Tax=Oryzibacter oryziterrae TaxID=2766474 RepID=UPI001EFFE50B|nr:heavy metal translocating P-type ATPase [Oryzibacter oryziterrae]